jgi:hypothetical protein
MRIHETTRVAADGDTSYHRVTFSIPGDDAPSTVGILHCQPVTIVLAYDLGGGYFMVADEPRPAIAGQIVRGLAGGTIDPTADEPLATAQRKLADELGLEARRWLMVASETYSSPGRTNEHASLWLAEGLTQVGEADRCTTPIRVPLDELDAEIARYRNDLRSGEPRKDLKTLTLLLALKLELVGPDR